MHNSVFVTLLDYEGTHVIFTFQVTSCRGTWELMMGACECDTEALSFVKVRKLIQ